MSDPMDKNGTGGDKSDRLAEALKRAEAAVRKSEKRDTESSPGKSEAAPSDSGAMPSFGEIALGDDETPSLPETAPSGASPPPSAAIPPPSFGEVDLAAGGDTSGLELDTAAKKKPAIPKPALLKDEEYDDDGWAEGKQQPKQQAPSAAEPAGEQMKVRRAALGKPSGDPAGSPQAANGQPAAPVTPPVEREGPSIRVSQAGPRRDWGPAIKILLIVILAIGLIGGGVVGYLKWKEHADAEEQAQLDALNQGSLDTLKKEALRKEQLGS